ncbi:unnamed protein product, partial [Amoebophrya sp. A25]
MWTSFESKRLKECVPFFVQHHLKRRFSKPTPIQAISWPILITGSAASSSTTSTGSSTASLNFIGVAPTG